MTDPCLYACFTKEKTGVILRTGVIPLITGRTVVCFRKRIFDSQTLLVRRNWRNCKEELATDLSPGWVDGSQSRTFLEERRSRNNTWRTQEWGAAC